MGWGRLCLDFAAFRACLVRDLLCIRTPLDLAFSGIHTVDGYSFRSYNFMSYNFRSSTKPSGFLPSPFEKVN